MLQAESKASSRWTPDWFIHVVIAKCYSTRIAFGSSISKQHSQGQGFEFLEKHILDVFSTKSSCLSVPNLSSVTHSFEDLMKQGL